MILVLYGIFIQNTVQLYFKIRYCQGDEVMIPLAEQRVLDEDNAARAQLARASKQQEGRQ